MEFPTFARLNIPFCRPGLAGSAKCNALLRKAYAMLRMIASLASIANLWHMWGKRKNCECSDETIRDQQKLPQQRSGSLAVEVFRNMQWLQRHEGISQ
eukprot:4631846-Pleurochrysis_carterae.AAC.2